MWLTCLATLTLVFAWRLWAQGPRHALGCIVLLSMLAPKWLMQEIGSLPIDLRVASAIVALSAYCLHRQGTIRTPLVWLDFLMLALVATHLISDWSNDGFRWSVPLRAYGEWVLPYLAGRLAIQSLDDVHQLLPLATVVAVVLASWAIIEALSGINIPELAFDPRPLDGVPREISRWGLRRAYGPTMNPIFFGHLQLLLFPWAVYAATRAKHHAGPTWWRLAPWIAALGICATISRGPQAALLILLYVATLLLVRRWRPMLIAVGVAGVIFAATQHELVINWLHLWAGRALPANAPRIIVDGEEMLSTGTLDRLHLFRVYRTAMQRAGSFGYGTEAVTGFPINVPVGPQDVATLKRIRFIDNVYILILLRFGYVGGACFLLLGLLAAGTYALMALTPHTDGTVFYASMAGSITAMLLLLLTVWMPHDFGFVYLWCLGTAAGLTAHGAWRSADKSDSPEAA